AMSRAMTSRDWSARDPPLAATYFATVSTRRRTAAERTLPDRNESFAPPRCNATRFAERPAAFVKVTALTKRDAAQRAREAQAEHRNFGVFAVIRLPSRAERPHGIHGISRGRLPRTRWPVMNRVGSQLVPSDATLPPTHAHALHPTCPQLRTPPTAVCRDGRAPPARGLLPCR